MLMMVLFVSSRVVLFYKSKPYETGGVTGWVRIAGHTLKMLHGISATLLA